MIGKSYLSEAIRCCNVFREKSLSSYPHPQSRKLELSKSNMRRLRVGDYRIVYTVDDIQKVVRILYVRHRKDSY
ncbi:MAG: type II toxin-antitoxin system RelE/ParE family toxin [Candidatus Magnetobacterium sp. LHC-1]|nr:type II toxin-antitoxin system RelE/ParE family toxin [Nitrospirota bacterium]